MRYDHTRYAVHNELLPGARSHTTSVLSAPDSPIRFPIAPKDEEPIGLVYMRSPGESNPDAELTNDAEVSVDHDWLVAEALANLGIPGWRNKARARASIMGYGSDPNLLITPNPPVAV